ncbi:SEL1-like repeat protein [Cardiobacterium valvarum]|uniref:Sel1 repeat protein n=1 Tax=Cardiobacterium valvarum F0432 TaxID=797473 RepID=G9ZDW1_9GAMM|nr:SEL1-like repeat protein [Cardiobacterium valvarum]EHM55108.1 Sel1 repeat protein [Cardiobacterium valvarum F0432]
MNARNWYEKAAVQGNIFAANNLALLYKEGQGVAQDYGKAREWLEKAAAQGDAAAQYNLGQLY